ncbi:MAG: hypothetical protein LBV43_05830 [Prevotella sp.]|jgi:hypothetical protein|nr:hypothetical protein [Prevotella sp.]
MKYLALFLSFLLITMIACNSSSSKVDYYKEYHPIYGVVLDSLNDDQKAFLKDLTILLFENMVVENNRMKFNLTKEEFVAKGFAEGYYSNVLKNVNDINLHLEATGEENVEEMLNGSREEILESLKK